MASFPLRQKSLFDFNQFNDLIHDYAFYFPAANASFVPRKTKLVFRQLTFAARKQLLSVTPRQLAPALSHSLAHLSESMKPHLKEFERQLETLYFNLYYHEQQPYAPEFTGFLRGRYGDLEADYDIKEHLRLSLTLIKKRYLEEPIKDPVTYLKYLDINNKRSHRDYVFADLRAMFFGEQNHVEEVNTERLFDYRISKRVKAEVEAVLRTALVGVQEPQEAVVA